MNPDPYVITFVFKTSEQTKECNFSDETTSQSCRLAFSMPEMMKYDILLFIVRVNEMNTIERLKKEDLKDIYVYMEEDFPDDERKSLKMIEDMYTKGVMEGYGFYNDAHELLAYALFVCIDTYRLFDYLAVVKEYRNAGIGSQFLSLLQQKMKDISFVIGEVENPDYCTDEKEKEVMERRIAFYLKNGFHDTKASGQVYHVEYRFMEMPTKNVHNATQAYEIMEKFYRMYWPKEADYARYVQMHNEKENTLS